MFLACRHGSRLPRLVVDCVPLHTACVLAAHQQAAEGEVRFEGIACNVEGLDEPISLDVTALGAVASQVEKEVLTFYATVRTTETKTVK